MRSHVTRRMPPSIQENATPPPSWVWTRSPRNICVASDRPVDRRSYPQPCLPRSTNHGCRGCAGTATHSTLQEKRVANEISRNSSR